MFRKRNVATLFIALAVIALCGHAVSHAQQNALAIFNLTPTNMEAMGYDGEILYALISVLERNKSIELMPRREMEETLFHAGLVQGGDTESIAKAGKILGINFVLYGNVTKKGGQILATLKLMDVQQKRLVKTWDKRFTGRENILDEIPALARELSDVIVNGGQAYAVPAAGNAKPAIDIENLKAQSQGENVVLTWKFDPSHPILAFNVYRSENATGPYQYHGKTESNTFTDDKIKKGKTYYYRVGIMLSSGKEVKSAINTQIKSAGEKVPHPPLVLTSKGHIRRTEINFVPSLLNEQEKFKIKEYKIYRKKGSQEDWKEISSISAVSESQSGLGFNIEDRKDLEDGQTYFYAFSSMDKQKRESLLSDTVAVKTIERPVLAVEKENLLRKTELAWEPLEDISGYYVYRRQDQQDWQKVARLSSASQTKHTDDKSLQDGQIYQYYLTAYDDKGESGPSKIVQAKTKDLPPYPQDVLTQSGLVKSVKILWTPIDDPDVGGYEIYRGTSPEELKKIDKIRGYQSNSYLDDGTGFENLKDGQDYFYGIVSYNLFGAGGDRTAAVKATTKPRPAPVKGFVAEKGSDYIQIQWDKNVEDDIKSYSLYRSRNSGFWSEIKTFTSDQNSYKDTDLQPEMQYRYKIIVEDQDSLESDPTESETVDSPIIKAKK